MSGPFAGLTVVEIGQFVVVPFCAQLLADAGARVIKVEPLQGDSYRAWDDGLGESESRQFLIKNRGKESIALDLAHDDAPELLGALIRAADVVLINLSPAAVARRHLDYDSLRAINPRLVYGAVSAYGHVGPEAPLPGMDVVVQARSGLLHSLGAEVEGVPHHSEVQVADYSASLLLFGGISAALFARERTGLGQEVTVSLLAGALSVQNNALAHVHRHDDWRRRFVTEELPALRRDGASHATIEGRRTELRPDAPTHTAHYRVFATGDGFVAVGAGSPAARRRLCGVLDLDPGLPQGDPVGFGEQVGRRLAADTTQHWLEALRRAEVPVAVVQHVDELLFDPHALAEGLIDDYEHPEIGTYRGLGVPIRMSHTPFSSSGASPGFAADTHHVLTDLGFGPDHIDRLEIQGAIRTSAHPEGDDDAVSHDRPHPR